MVSTMTTAPSFRNTNGKAGKPARDSWFITQFDPLHVKMLAAIGLVAHDFGYNMVQLR